MNCRCLTDTADRLKTRVLDDDMNPPKGAELQHVNATGSVLGFRTGKFMLAIPFTVTWKLPNGKLKETSVNMIASFCPFCGKAAEEKSKPKKARKKKPAPQGRHCCVATVRPHPPMPSHVVAVDSTTL